MNGGVVRICWSGLVLILLITCTTVSGLPPGFCLGGEDTIALGVFAPERSPSGEERIFLDEIFSFRESSGEKPLIGVFSDEWMVDRKFPLENVRLLRKEGMIPYIRLMMRSSDNPYQKEPIYTLGNIALGKFDGELRSWAREARSHGSPILIEYGTEINKWNYPWNGYWNGHEKGQALFRDAYRHIVDVFKEEGASNLIWIYHVNADSQPHEDWNNITGYYPGDDYCDMVAVSLFGTTKPFETGTRPFKETMVETLKILQAGGIQKPVLLITGTDVQGRFEDPAAFVTDIISTLSGPDRPDIRGLIWLNSAWKNDNNPLHDTTMRLQDNSSVAAAFKKGLQSLNVQESAICSPAQ
jgi:hypothetical protein